MNVTTGSFVCTTCSGMLRGLTPPHRVKSITMATFTPEEIEIMKSRGNQYCKNIWLGLYDSEIPTSDEQQIKDFMIAKYEKKRYYVDPASSNTHCVLNFGNGSRTPSSLSSTSSSSHNSPSSQHLSDSSSKIQSTCTLRSQPSKITSVTSNGNSQLFTSNFESPVSSAPLVDPFGSSGMDSSSSSETSFANFDNNPAFDAIKVVPGIATENTSKFGTNKNESIVPSEDKYAALKDLDCQMKSQLLEKQQEEMKQKQSTTSNGVNWSSLFGNNQSISSEPSTPFNPFSDETNAWNPPANGTVNPFSNNIKDSWNGNSSWQNAKNTLTNAATVTPNGWKNEEANPFKFQMGVWTQTNGQHQSSNPFL